MPNCNATSPASRPNDIYRLVCDAINPIIAGPIRIPIYPSVLTADTAMFRGIIVCLPSREKNIGTMFALPIPIRKKPA